MHSSFRAFMQELIDYAGLFPPARLTLEEAFNKYLNYQDHPSGWILSHFICPVRLLPELIKYQNILQDKDIQLSLSVLPDSAENSREYLLAFEKNIQQLEDFLQRMDRSAAISAFEFRISSKLLSDKSFPPLHEFFLSLYEKIQQVGILQPILFFELQKTEHWLNHIDLFVEEIELFNKILQDNKFTVAQRTAGLKLRCGGESPENFPPPEEISRVLSACSAKQILFKATAGLHHPVRHHNTSIQNMMHGFFNVFGAALLAYHHHLSNDEILTLINEEDPRQFLFTDDHFTYKGWKLTLSEIQELRAKYVISFGSCSFEEPREDLIQLGLLTE
jgi:hypothetical protein